MGRRGKTARMRKEKRERKSEEDSQAKKTLFICSGVYLDAAVSYVVLSTDTASLLWTIHSQKSHTHNLVHEASISAEFLPAKAGCGVVGSKILIAGGERGRFKSVCGADVYIPRPVKDVYAFEADANGNGKIQLVPDIFFGQGKTRPLVVELQGKVYALGHSFLSDHPPYLEMLDPKGSNKWVPMPDPPPFKRHSSTTSGLQEITYAVVGNRIMVSDANYEVISVFDVTDPSKLWKEIPGTFFDWKAKTLALDLEALYGCKGHSGILTYSSENGRVINNYVDNGLSITPWGKFYLSDEIMPPQVVGKPDSYCLIQLGGPKVCLLLSKLKGPFSYQNRAKEAKLTVLALVFEYLFPGFKLKFLGNSILSYPCPKETTKAEIFGGFVMDISKV